MYMYGSLIWIWWMLLSKLCMDVYRQRIHNICKLIHFITIDDISAQQQWIGRFYYACSYFVGIIHSVELEDESLTMRLLCFIFLVTSIESFRCNSDILLIIWLAGNQELERNGFWIESLYFMYMQIEGRYL